MSGEIDYSRDIARVRTACHASRLHSLLRRPAKVVAGALGKGFARGLLEAASEDGNAIYNALDLHWSRRYGVTPSRTRSPLLYTLWRGSDEVIGNVIAHMTYFEYRVVLGVPYGLNEHEGGYAQSPASDEQLFERMRGSNWVFSVGAKGGATVEVDTPAIGIVDEKTRKIVDDTKSIAGCRARVLWGPPRAGKSVAAKQIAREVTGSWARVCGAACTSAEVWRALDVLRPSALIIDDIDIGAGEESALMRGLEQAHTWARVIISTANVLEGERAVRGAVLGRASTGLPVEYSTLSPEVRKAIAPHVPEDLGASDLLAQWQSELQRRALKRTVTRADVDELRALQKLVGER